MLADEAALDGADDEGAGAGEGVEDFDAFGAEAFIKAEFALEDVVHAADDEVDDFDRGVDDAEFFGHAREGVFEEFVVEFDDDALAAFGVVDAFGAVCHGVVEGLQAALVGRRGAFAEQVEHAVHGFGDRVLLGEFVVFEEGVEDGAGDELLREHFDGVFGGDVGLDVFAQAGEVFVEFRGVVAGVQVLADGFDLAVEIGTPINAAILPVMTELTAYLDSLIPAVQEFAGIMASALSGTLSVITPIVSGIAELVSIMGGAETVIASAAAALLMFVGNTKAAAASTVSFKAQMISLGTTIKGLSFSSFVTGYRAALTGLRTTMASTLAGLKMTWSVAWTAMATVTRTAMVAVKAALVSTGIGLIIVAIGEALGALYSWFMGNSEAAEQAAESARKFEKSLRSLNKQADKVKTYDQYDSFMEQLDERMDDMRDQRDMAVAKDEDEEVIALLDQQIARLRERRKHYEETLPDQIEAALAEERAAEALRKQKEAAEELERRLTAARDKLNDLSKRQRETERENYLSGLDTETQIELRLADVTDYGKTRLTLQGLRDEMRSILRKPVVTEQDTARYEKLATTLNKIVALQKRGREEAERTAEAEKRLQDEKAKEEAAKQKAAQDYDMQVKMLQAEISGNEKKLELLRQQQRITHLTLEYQRQGLADAEARARRMAELEQAAESAKQSRQKTQNQGLNRDSAARMSSSMAAVGGGGRSLLIGGPMLTESKKQTKLLGQMDDSLKKRPSIQVSGNVEAVIAD